MTEAGLTREAIRQDGSPAPEAEFPGTLTLQAERPCSDVIMGIQRPDRALVWISVNSRPLPGSVEGARHGVVLSFPDVTERRRVEADRERDLRDALASVEGAGRHPHDLRFLQEDPRPHKRVVAP